MKDKEKKDPAAVKPTRSLRKADAKRLLHSKGLAIESPEGKIIAEFLETYPSSSTTILSLEMLWFFLAWLKSKKIHLVDSQDVFCVPFSYLVRCKDLK